MKCYKLRVDLQTLSLEDVVGIFGDSDAYAYVYETGKTKDNPNPHLHAYLETDVPSSTLRSRIRTRGLSGNKCYSLKKVEQHPLEYLAYMRKENEIHYHNIPQSVIEASIDYDNKVREEMKKAKEAKKKVIEVLDGYVPEYKHDETERGDTRRSYLSHIMQHLVEYHKEHNKIINPNQIQNYAITILLRREPWFTGYFVSDWIERIAK
jgi:hypothetical protein